MSERIKKNCNSADKTLSCRNSIDCCECPMEETFDEAFGKLLESMRYGE